MSLKKILIIISLIILTMLAGAAAFVYFVPDPEEPLVAYREYWQNRNYEEIHDLLTEEKITEFTAAEIATAYENFDQMAGIESREILEENMVEDTFSRREIELKTIVDSKYFGERELTYNITLLRENLVDWKLSWDRQLIHPRLEEGETFVRERFLPDRGNIYDREGRELAVDGEAVSVGVQPSRMDDREELVKNLEEILDLRAEGIEREIDRYPQNPDWFVPIKTLSMDRYRELEPKLRPIPGVVFRKRSARIYPQSELTAHITGYLGEVNEEYLLANQDQDYRSGELAGKSGLELALESELRGSPGYKLYLQDQGGERREIMNVDTRDGSDIYLTIDVDYQRLALEALAGQTGSIVLLAPDTGKVLAAANNPAYDPNSFTLGMDMDTWESLISDKDSPLLDRAFRGRYPPGSSFKIVTASTALDTGLVDAETEFVDEGEYRVRGNIIRNYQQEVFEEHTFREAVKHSINTTFARIGVELGAETLLDYAEKFGFNQGLETDVPARESSFPIPNSPVELAWSAVGQGRVLVTPLQMARIAGVIAADGKDPYPEIVERIENETGGKGVKDQVSTRILAEDTAETMTELMVEVVEGGTGKRIDIEDIKVAGKTGTAEIDSSDTTHAWFIGFAPAEEPEIAFAVFCERGGVGGEVAAPIAGNLIKSILEFDKLN